jgi:predicted transcriptional regulator of viral defense system
LFGHARAGDHPRMPRAEPFNIRKELHLAQVAGRQHRVITSRQTGLSDRAIAWRVKSGRLYRRHRGVYVVGPGELSPHGVCLAAVLAIGDDAVLDDMSAGYIWGFWKRLTEPIHVAVPRKLRSRPGIRVHVRRLDARDTTIRSGIPIVSVAHALLSMATTLYSDKALRRAIHEAEVQRLVTHPWLRAQITRYPGRAADRLARLIEPGPLPTRSGDEDEVVEMLLRHGFPRPLTNTRIPGLPTWVEVDIYLPDYQLVIDVDSVFHDTDFRREEDARKQALLERHGLRVLRVRKEDALEHELETIDYVRRAIAAQPNSCRAADGR